MTFPYDDTPGYDENGDYINIDTRDQYFYQSEQDLSLTMPIPHRIPNVYKERIPTQHYHATGWGIPGLKVSGSAIRTNFRHEVDGEIVEYAHEYRAISKVVIFGCVWNIDYHRKRGEIFSIKIWFGGGG